MQNAPRKEKLPGRNEGPLTLYDKQSLLGYLALRRTPSTQPIACPVASSDVSGGLQHLNLFSHPDRAVFDYPCADATTTLQGLRHTRFGKALDIPADRARPPILERSLPDTEPLAASQGLQAYPPGDDVAPVLAILYTHAGLSFDIVEVLGCDEGYFADPAEAAPVPGAGTVAVTLEATAFENGGHLDTLHLCTTFRSKEYAFHETRHHQPSFKSCSSLWRGTPVSWASNTTTTDQKKPGFHRHHHHGRHTPRMRGVPWGPCVTLRRGNPHDCHSNRYGDRHRGNNLGKRLLRRCDARDGDLRAFSNTGNDLLRSWLLVP